MPRKPDLARRADIARAALDALSEGGVHKATMKDVARVLGMKRPTLYWYFKDLSELCEAILSDTFSRLTAFVAAKIQGLEHPLDVVEQMMRGGIDFHEGRRDRILTLLQLWAVTGAEGSLLERGRQFVTPARWMLQDLVRRGVESGQVGPCDPVALVDMALAVADGALIQLVTGEAETEVIFAAFTAQVLDPLRRRSRPVSHAPRHHTKDLTP